MIQSEYGSKHEEVLDMPICTLRQKIANIEFRNKSNRIYQNTIAEWQTRTLAQFIAATVPVSKKGEKSKIAEEADKIRLRLEDPKGKADADAPPEVFIEKGSQTAQNAPGSFERLVAGFGGLPST